MAAKKKPALAPDAARILAQYRDAGKNPGGAEKSASSDGAAPGSTPSRPTSPAPGASTMRRSGTRGK